MKIKLIDFPLKKPSLNHLRDKLKQLSDELKLKGSCSIIFTDDKFLRKLHKEYFQNDTPTDVITFNLGDSKPEGEIYISKERAEKQAKQYHSSYACELLRYTVHGFLHLAGYDDKTVNEYKSMKKLEDKYLELYFPELFKEL